MLCLNASVVCFVYDPKKLAATYLMQSTADPRKTTFASDSFTSRLIDSRMTENHTRTYMCPEAAKQNVNESKPSDLTGSKTTRTPRQQKQDQFKIT